MSKRLLREFYELRCDDRGCKDYLTEGEKSMLKEGKLIFAAKLQEAETPNGNRRSYPRDVLMRKEPWANVITQRAKLLVLRMHLIWLIEFGGTAMTFLELFKF